LPGLSWGDEGRSTIALTLYITVATVFVPGWNWLTHRYDKRRLLLAAILVGSSFLFVIGMLLQKEQIGLFYLGCSLMAVAFSAYMLIPYSLAPDLVDYYEHKTGQRHDSVFFGLWNAVHQAGIAAARLLLGVFLQIFGYDGRLAVQAAPAQMAVRLALGVLPGVFFILAAVTLQMYAITRQVFYQIQADLKRPLQVR
jgi:GPH family glycoside/pentoside/hexuronide:cation symporter